MLSGATMGTSFNIKVRGRYPIRRGQNLTLDAHRKTTSEAEQVPNKPDTKEALLAGVQGVLDAVEGNMSTYNEASELMLLNGTPPGRDVVISSALASVLSLARRWVGPVMDCLMFRSGPWLRLGALAPGNAGQQSPQRTRSGVTGSGRAR